MDNTKNVSQISIFVELFNNVKITKGDMIIPVKFVNIAITIATASLPKVYRFVHIEFGLKSINVKYGYLQQQLLIPQSLQ